MEGAAITRCKEPVIWSVGHSTLTPEQFLALLTPFAIQQVVDIRAYPFSRRFPWFAQAAMAGWLEAAEVTYRHLPGLGGRRQLHHPDPSLVGGWQNPAFQAYAAYMQEEAFWQALAELLGQARLARTAMMCSEALWWRCHRRLVADALVCLGVEVIHLGAGGPSRHRLTSFGHWDGRRLRYPAPLVP